MSGQYVSFQVENSDGGVGLFFIHSFTLPAGFLHAEGLSWASWIKLDFDVGNSISCTARPR